MTILVHARETADALERLISSADSIWIASAWASDGTAAAEALWKAKRRIAALVVGTDFYQTDPKFLRRFRAHAVVHAVANATFHPKLYVFRHGDAFEAIIGSSNFTAAGLSTNVEGNLHVKGAAADDTFASLTRFIEDLAKDGRQFVDADLDHYERMFRQRRRDVERVRTYVPPARTIDHGALHIDWDTYVRRLVRAGARHGLFRDRESIGYVGVIEDIQAIFTKRKTLAAMSKDERDRVAGLVRPYLYFGSMRGAGYFKSMVHNEPAKLDAALDHVPRTGPVERQHFASFVQTVTKLKGMGKPAVGTRLLAMKRPDVFFCIDSANRTALSEAFGVSTNHLNSYDGYWEMLERLWKCPWFSAPCPPGKHAAIWRARVALIDAFYYDG